MEAFSIHRILGAVKRVLKSTRRFLPNVYYVLSCLCVFTAILAVVTSFYRPCVVNGTSMVPTLKGGDQVLLSCKSNPERGDIVAVRRESEVPLIKRVIAVGGDTLYINAQDGLVYVNGIALEETYIQGSTPQKELSGQITVPEGKLFVLGDNRATSHDSRYKDIGLIALEDILGVAVFRFAPLSGFGGL